MEKEQCKQFTDWINKAIISSNQDIIDNYHTSGRKYYEGYNDGLIDVKTKMEYLIKGLE